MTDAEDEALARALCSSPDDRGWDGKREWQRVIPLVAAVRASGWVPPGEVAKLRNEVNEWRSRLSAVMPAGFKDWYENDPAEWPMIAARVIELQRKEIELWTSYLAEMGPNETPDLSDNVGSCERGADQRR